MEHRFYPLPGKNAQKALYDHHHRATADKNDFCHWPQPEEKKISVNTTFWSVSPSFISQVNKYLLFVQKKIQLR
mgnify:FL=1